MLINIDANKLQKLFIAAAKRLESKKEYVNELNVFPVPDGDTGTNMSLTILAAAKEVSKVENPTMENVAKAISSGALRGARGNSGVILSQLFRGFSKEIMKNDVIDTIILANAFQGGVETAYKAVMKPKEGTILTVAKAVAEKALQLAINTDDIETVLLESIKHGENILNQTPEMLPVLKQAGVVDAGGQGLMLILQGAYDALIGKEIDVTFEDDMQSTTNIQSVPKLNHEQNIKYGYCTEFIVNIKTKDDSYEQTLKIYLETIGDSIVVVSDEDIIKVHVHTNDPGLALQKALNIGTLSNIKIDNMREQHTSKVLQANELNTNVQKVQTNSVDQETNKKNKERKLCGFIAVSIGEGLNEIFKELGVDHIIEGGQTMNPSTEDVLNAIEQVNADHVIILPNNKNIILAAQQAQEMIKNKKVHVIPSKTIPQGINALIQYNHSKQPEDNVESINKVIGDVKSGQITFAVRDTKIDEKEIKQGDYLGIADDKILVVGKEMIQTVKELIANLVNKDSELIALYYGKEAEKDMVDDLKTYIESTYEDCELEVHYGGQPLYYFILSVE